MYNISMNTSSVTKEDIIAGLRALGLFPGAGVMVHSSLKSFGQVDGGAAAVLAALIEVVTPEGTLMLPSFNHGAPFQKGGPGYYHPEETPTTNGAIPELFWRLPGVRRSLDPTHPVAAWGRHARRYTEFHHRTLTMGRQSPLGLLGEEGGYCLLLGVGYGSNTFHHVVEMTTGAPCLGQRSEAYPVRLPDGHCVNGRTWGWRARPCPLNDSALYQEEMSARGLHNIVQIGSCRATLYRMQDGFEVIAGLLEQGKHGYPPCRSCPIRPRHAPQTVASDWDPEKQTILPDSEAWLY